MALGRRRFLAALNEGPDTVGIFRSKTVSVIVQPSDMSPVEAPNHHPISATGDTPTPFQLPQSSSGAIGEILGFRAQRYQLGLVFGGGTHAGPRSLRAQLFRHRRREGPAGITRVGGPDADALWLRGSSSSAEAIVVHKNGLLSRANHTRATFHERLAVYCVQYFLEAGIAAEGLMQVGARDSTFVRCRHPGTVTVAYVGHRNAASYNCLPVHRGGAGTVSGSDVRFVPSPLSQSHAARERGKRRGPPVLRYETAGLLGSALAVRPTSALLPKSFPTDSRGADDIRQSLRLPSSYGGAYEAAVGPGDAGGDDVRKLTACCSTDAMQPSVSKLDSTYDTDAPRTD
ncbi:hypothetical protein PHLGIDRAFT_16038 [Phlebiopsis gigantea 11061_1 CR5-6]|uniref:Uncharacterized protein n=1 Tax=Phlebiopsis gigantea (strain 11061_1 CR5-6) TaxID=745531 RepID=A0A0C3RS87_PHLG1|nr:hypothetical protein PHLGIDRAFT_16038 [Phlebiopsis gigantea 11061_1 CR5-6]